MMMRLRKHVPHSLIDYYGPIMREGARVKITGECISMVIFVFVFGLLLIGWIFVHHYR